jgi:hypothetical protein
MSQHVSSEHFCYVEYLQTKKTIFGDVSIHAQ